MARRGTHVDQVSILPPDEYLGSEAGGALGVCGTAAWSFGATMGLSGVELKNKQGITGERETSMAETSTLDEETILRAVREWPREQQIHLAQRILDPGLATLNPRTGRPSVASAELRGVGKGDRPAPSDEQIARWRDEKYAD